jgi:two-component system response regulator VicR
MKILVCVKEEVLLTALEFRLRRQGYEVESAPNGQQAREKILSWSPDLAIIGTEIAKLPGLKLVEELRDGGRSSKMPIILVAPLEAEDDIMRGYALGVNDFVTKPFKPVELVLRVRRIFEVSKGN